MRTAAALWLERTRSCAVAISGADRASQMSPKRSPRGAPHEDESDRVASGARRVLPGADAQR